MAGSEGSLVLVTGSTGYVGGRLVPRLLEQGHQVRVLVRDASRVQGRPWSSQVEIVTGDLLVPDTLPPAFAGIGAAYYLVHSMLSGSDFQKRDREAARNFASFAARHGTKTIYLGGLLPRRQDSPNDQGVSRHLQSRAEVGEILRELLPATEFRAGPVIGSGSASFEMLRYLTERLPVMITPQWVSNEVQPIAIKDVLSYLVAALSVPAAGIVEIGADRLTFKKMMEIFAEERKLRHRRFVQVPVLAPGLAALWVGLVTPIPNSMAVPIIEGITHSVLADTGKAKELFPTIIPMPFRDAVRLAMEQTRELVSETHWSDALHTPSDSSKLRDEEGMIREIRAIHVHAPPEAIFRQFTSLGGERGWLKWNLAWKIRGLVDRLVGGPGLRRGRRHPDEVFPGDAIDFWRVEEVKRPYLLRLHAEMRLPGSAWIEWETHPEGSGGRLVQTAFFSPKGLGGFLYWYALYPIHSLIFRALVREIGKRAEAA